MHEAKAISWFDDDKIFGFWVYLMTDLVIFSVLFATFIVLRDNTFGGPTARELLELPSALSQTLILLTSSFTCAMGTLAVQQAEKKLSILWFLVTFVLGVFFLIIELFEFSSFVQKGASWQRSAFLSSFFTLVGTHGLHISVGLLWMVVAMFRIVLRPFSALGLSRIYRMAFFWHFLDIVWVFIFTVVYGLSHLI
jgi:heme/copper-type cytochrome/quinol oxidase subunit 3